MLDINITWGWEERQCPKKIWERVYFHNTTSTTATAAAAATATATATAATATATATATTNNWHNITKTKNKQLPQVSHK